MKRLVIFTILLSIFHAGLSQEPDYNAPVPFDEKVRLEN